MNSQKTEKKVVITGASGFLGRNLVNALKDRESYFVYALSSRSDTFQKGNISTNIHYCHKDAVFTQNGAQILKDAILVNCAFPRNSTGIGMADGLRYIQRLFDKACECGCQAIINISSQSVYSSAREESATEETPVCLESPYAVGKYATELMLESACRGTGTAYTNLRMASLIGPGFDQRIVNRFVKQALRGETLHVTKSEQRFGFLDVDDAVCAILALTASRISKWKGVYNVGNAKGYTVKEIAGCIQNIFEKNGILMPPISLEEGMGTGSSAVGYRLLHDDTSFEPYVDLQESVQKILSSAQRDGV